jgi:hypothetical protein
VVWLLIVQRLLGNASLAQAVVHFLENLSIAPENRRVTEQTLSAATGADSRARTRLAPDVAEAVADEIGESLLQSTPPASNQHGTSAWLIRHWAIVLEIARTTW